MSTYIGMYRCRLVECGKWSDWHVSCQVISLELKEKATYKRIHTNLYLTASMRSSYSSTFWPLRFENLPNLGHPIHHS